VRRLAGPCFPKLLKGAATEDDPQDKERRKAEQEAKKLFTHAYTAQQNRIAAKIKASGGKLSPSAWKSEPAQLAQAVLPFYESTATQAAQSALDSLPIEVDWGMVNKPVLALARQRAQQFGEMATATSQERTAARIASWVESGGTMKDLIESVSEVWSGPRADVAAATEVTDLYSAGNLAAWDSSGLVTGYNFNTAEDRLVDPDCAEAADNGPYDLDDDEHRPPLHPNCRCWVTPVVKEPGEE
jgi:SPP1 gp7 family putative phage head morphogenesis protein